VSVQAAARTPLADATLGGTLVARATLTDPDGGRWQFEQVFKLNTAGSLLVEATARCDQDREVLYLPLFTLLPGLGCFGTNKTQALLAGVEYLENEPSSSTADLNPPASNRQVADTAKLTFPRRTATWRWPGPSRPARPPARSSTRRTVCSAPARSSWACCFPARTG
jgi:hypothetical protein